MPSTVLDGEDASTKGKNKGSLLMELTWYLRETQKNEQINQEYISKVISSMTK